MQSRVHARMLVCTGLGFRLDLGQLQSRVLASKCLRCFRFVSVCACARVRVRECGCVLCVRAGTVSACMHACTLLCAYSKVTVRFLGFCAVFFLCAMLVFFVFLCWVFVRGFKYVHVCETPYVCMYVYAHARCIHTYMHKSHIHSCTLVYVYTYTHT